MQPWLISLPMLSGSIVLYSLANLANGLVQDVPTYAVLRFVAETRTRRRGTQDTFAAILPQLPMPLAARPLSAFPLPAPPYAC